MIQIEYILVAAALCICSITLFIFSWSSYRKYQNKKLLFILGVFLFFFFRAVLFTIGVFYEPLVSFTSSIYPWIIDLVILNLLYLAALKR